mmetsp:Transcript_12642/g.29344  ORF Transcript_12642/g.29344 Transcript_12642/m.29344 type:complete len:251 (+) Transcript_12642:376-1128(+)
MAHAQVVQAQLGAVVNILISTMMGQSQTALVIFSSERSLFLREYSTNHYSIVTYFLSHLMTEALQALSAVLVQVWALGFLEKLSINCLVPYLPVRSTVKQALIVYWMIGFQMYFLEFLAITYCLSMTSTAVSVLLGAMVSDIKSASALFTLVVVPQFYFSGVFIATNLIPIWVRWAQYTTSLKYAAGLAFIYEFGNCGDAVSQANCDDVLAQNGVSTDDLWWYWLALAALFVSFRGMALYVLHRKGKDFF